MQHLPGLCWPAWAHYSGHRCDQEAGRRSDLQALSSLTTRGVCGEQAAQPAPAATAGKRAWSAPRRWASIQAVIVLTASVSWSARSGSGAAASRAALATSPSSGILIRASGTGKTWQGTTPGSCAAAPGITAPPGVAAATATGTVLGTGTAAGGFVASGPLLLNLVLVFCPLSFSATLVLCRINPALPCTG